MIDGQQISAVFWNLAVRNNMVALREGGIALASQAAGDLMLASSSTQWTRLAGSDKATALFGASTWGTSIIFDTFYPVGRIFVCLNNTNPATLFGRGTWSQVSTGRVMVGFDSGQTEFDTVNEQGGEKTHVLTTGEMPSHTHAPTDPGHFHLSGDVNDRGGPSTAHRFSDDYPGTDGSVTSSSNATGVTLANEGGGGAHQNMSPYITVCIWVRVS